MKKVRLTLVHERLEITCEFGPTKCTSSAYYISALRGCCAKKFLHVQEIDQSYVAHTPTGTEVPPPKKKTKFNREH